MAVAQSHVSVTLEIEFYRTSDLTRVVIQMLSTSALKNAFLVTLSCTFNAPEIIPETHLFTVIH